ncbi:otoferlin isoform X2 [Sitodiplosis mosellana]|uniref:otoferlin isoform X2 n=1 Tax=Sitodiplosis mosellana TaxID=263140 RepID=UPI0024447DEC|nr:otoferlin isoform X2 [Sitodiplosis mosellana]
MSLTVRILEFRLPKPKANLIGRVEFRGMAHTTNELASKTNILEVNQSFIWPLARPSTADESVVVELRTQTTKILLKTGLASTSTSRGTIASNSKMVGRYVMLMQGLINAQRLRIEDRLTDLNNKPIDVIVVFEISYKSPDDEAGNFEPRHLVDPIQRQHHHVHGQSDSIDDDQQKLLDIEQNIANLEKNLIRDKDSDECRQPRRSRKRDFLKRVMSSSHHRSNTIEISDSERNFDAPTRDAKSIENPGSSSKVHSLNEKKVSLRTVRQFMRLGKSKQQSSRRDSSTEDENRSLISDVDGGGFTSAHDSQNDRSDNISQTPSYDSSDGEEEEEFTVESKSKRVRPVTRLEQHLKAQDFQVCVTIIEARQLPGLNMDPVVCIQIGDQKKYTSVKESTNCPYYNEYFVFDFHMAPAMLFDKIITLSVLHSRRFLRSGTVVGSFKIDLKTVYDAKDHQFYHKWALLTDPDDFISGPKGYLKCDIGIIGKGDTVKMQPKSEKDHDDIEANLLLPEGVPIERQRAKFVIKIYRADGLPRMNSSIMANVKRAFTGESKDLVSPFVHVSFAGLSGKTTVKKNSYNPSWNEELIFTEMFPPLCQRIKVQLRDADPMKPSIIGTHYIDLKQISNDGEKGFLPTFGPSFIHLYGSTRDYSLLDQHSNLNTGLGEGVSYRARLLIAIRTEITDNVETTMEKNVELQPTMPVCETSYSKIEEFFLFSTIMEATMIDKKLSDKSVYFELSVGNAGNSIDGHNESQCSNVGDDGELETVDTTAFNSTTNSCKPISHDKLYYYLPYWDYKPCMNVRCHFPDLRRRMYNSNMIAKLVDAMEEGLHNTNSLIENEDARAEVKLRTTLEELASGCLKYVAITKNSLTGPGTGKTKLDKERMKLCEREIEAIGNMARNLRALVTKNSMKERFRTAQTYLQKLKFLVDDPQHSLPDVFIWLIANGKRIAYHRIFARDLIYSMIEEECGIHCGKVQTIMLRLPGNKSNTPAGWTVQSKLSIYLWLGIIQNRQFSYSGLPKGFDLSPEIRNAERPGALAPSNIHYLEKHTFQLRAHLYQARSLIGSDASGLSDPYATVYITEFAKTTQVIEETLSPTWDELLLFDDVLVYGTKEEIKKNPPTVVIEIYDQDKVGKSEFIGRTIAKPRIKLKENPYVIPTLDWFAIERGLDNAGELLAAFEMIEYGSENIGNLPEPKPLNYEFPRERSSLPIQTIMPVPREIRPHLAMYRLKVLLWGLRDLKRIHFMSVDRPRIDVECSGKILSSSIIQNAKKNPNFPTMLKFFDLELPIEENYAPPITIRCVDCRSFGRYTLVGTHQITSIHKYIHRPAPKEDVSKYSTQGGQIILTVKTPNAQNGVEDKTTAPKNSSCEYITQYGAVCVSKITSKKSDRRKIALEPQETIDPDEDENSKDWWTKYFWSHEVLSELKSPFPQRKTQTQREEKLKIGLKGVKLVTKLSPKHAKKETVEAVKPNKALCHIYNNELENLPDYNNFKEWLLSFPLFRGKKTGDSTEDENRIVGFFKGAVKVYRLPLPKDVEPAFAPTIPTNDPIHVLVRVYIVKATDLHPMDLNGKADPYVVLQLGSKRVSDKENYVSKQLNPVFGKCFEIEATFPQDSLLNIQVLDWDLVGSDDLIGETKIDLENRFYSKHRATCGIALKYEEFGYNRWRDPMKPTQILQKLCKDNKLETPHYFQDRVVIGRYCMTFTEEEVFAWNGPTTCKNRDEHLALAVLHRWSEIPNVGCKIVPEHIESRSLYNPDKMGIEQGKLEMWVDMFPMDMPLPGPPVDISPRKPKSYELRVVIWNTDDVVLEDDAFFTGEKMSDIYVKGWLKGPQDVQATDIHYRSLTGEGNFNWRFIFPFDYLAAEERIVLSRKESLFSWDETEIKIPARLELQVWDNDKFSSDDFLGAISLNLNRFPRGAKSSKLCTLDMLKLDNVPTVNIFKQKRIRGWWPFFIKKENDELELTGKVEAEIHLLTKEESEQNPAGHGRNEPDALEKPNRPDASFMWFLNPLKSIRYIVWHNYKWSILKGFIILAVAFMLLLFFYSVPGYTVKKLLGA